VIRVAAHPWRVASPRPILLALAAVVLAIAGALTLIPTETHPVVVPPSLAQRLGVNTYGFAIPMSWLAAPIPGLHEDDVVDILGTRPGDRATATGVADGLRVMALDDRALVVELRADDAAAIAAARARGLSLIPILRSSR
jgi:hypothetical protein